jgi:hypothetical protein
MASFTDAIPQFNPYIQQLPVEAMVAVGMEKQKRYDEGVQKIQQTIDQVAGLDIYRTEDKQHLQSKLDQLTSKLRTFAAADFSNYQLTNSVAGMATKVAKDPIVLAAVQSTAVIKNNSKVIEDAREKGTLTPQNETHYNKQLQKYLQSGLTGEDGKPIKFNGKYVPYFDQFKYAKEVFDAVKPDEMTWDQVFDTDSNGNPKIDKSTGQPIYSPVMIRMEKEGRFPEKVRETLNQIFSDPRVTRQLQIDGEYNYQAYSPDMLKNRIITQEKSFQEASNEIIANLNLQKNTTESQEEKNKIDDQIESVKKSISSNREQYARLLETVDSNPDAIRGMLYSDEVRNRYTTMFGYTKTKRTTMANPGWQAKFQEDKERYDRYKDQRDFAYRQQRDVIADQKWQMDYGLKAAKDGLGKDGKPIPLSKEDFELANMESSHNVTSFISQYNASLENYEKSSNQLIFESLYSGLPEYEEKLRNLTTRVGRERAIESVLNEIAQKEGFSEFSEFRQVKLDESNSRINEKGYANVPKDLADAMAIYKNSKETYDNNKFIKDKLDDLDKTAASQVISSLLTGDEIKPQTIEFRGDKINLSKQDIVDLGIYIRGNKHVWGFAIDSNVRDSAKIAENRLRDSGKGVIVDYIYRNAMAGISPVTKVARTLRSPIESIVDDWSRLTGTTKFDFSQIGKVYDALNTDAYTDLLGSKNEIIKNNLSVSPNLKKGLLTGKAEVDNRTLENLQRIAGSYVSIGNISPDHKKFIENISKVTDPKKITLDLQTKNIGGQPVAEVVIRDESGNRAGGLTIQEDELRSIGVDISGVFVPNNITSLQNRINISGNNSTSYGNVNDINTYLNANPHNVYFQKSAGDFPLLSNFTDYDVMANIVYKNNAYYGKIFVRDMKNNKVFPIQTTSGYDLPTLYNTLRNLDSTYLMPVITNSK